MADLGVYKIGDKIPLTVTFQSASGEDTDVENPIIEIIYIDNNGSVQHTLQPTPMLKRSSDIKGDYYYLFEVQEGTPLTKYFVNYKGIVDGILTTAEDSFRVISSDSSPSSGTTLIPIQGSLYDLNIVDSNGLPIKDVVITVFNRTTGKSIVKTTTDSNGDFLVYLEPGSYLFHYKKDGFLAKTVEKVI